MAREKQPDVVLTDVRMPDMSGLELIGRLRCQSPLLRSVVISGFNDFDYAVKALKLRVEDYILKPIDPEVIKDVFTRLRINMNEEKIRQAHQQNRRYVCTEFEMIRRLFIDINIDINNDKNIDKNDEKRRMRFLLGPQKFRVLIFRQLNYRYDWTGPENREPSFPPGLLDLLNRYYFISTDAMLVVLFPGAQDVRAFIREVKQALGSEMKNYRIVVSGEVLGVENIIGAYLAASPLLYDDAAQVRYAEEASLQVSRENLTALRKTLIEQLETGCPVTNTLEQIAAAAEKSRNNPSHAYTQILWETSRYFQIQNWQPSTVLRDGIAFPRDAALKKEELTGAFLQDIEILRKQIQNRSGAMAAILVNRAREEIESHYDDPNLSLSGIARKFQVSYGYLSAVFSKITGTGFAHYVNEVRMEKARRLLLRRDLKIYEVAAMAGYSNIRYFSDAFKKHYGISPTAYVVRLGETRDEG
jgi:two-component system response regulator YesN